MGEPHVEDEELTLHFAAVLDPARSNVIHRHLRECATCRATADKVVAALAALALLDPPDTR